MLSKLSLIFIISLSLLIIMYSFRFGIGNIYSVGLEHQLDSYEQSIYSTEDKVSSHREQLRIIQDLTDELLKWDSFNPDNLSLASYVDYIIYNQVLSKDKTQKLDNALNMNSKAISQRPVFPDTYAFRTYLLTYLMFNDRNLSLNSVMNVFSKAKKFGPYEIPVAKAGIALLYAHWHELKKKDVYQAIDYIVAHRKYGLDSETLNEVIMRSPQKKTICGVAEFYQVRIRTCCKPPLK